jgi:hypothetical protein
MNLKQVSESRFGRLFLDFLLLIYPHDATRVTGFFRDGGGVK